MNSTVKSGGLVEAFKGIGPTLARIPGDVLDMFKDAKFGPSIPSSSASYPAPGK